LKKEAKTFCIFALVAGLLAPHASAGAADKFTVILDWFVDTNHAALFAAKYCGAYAAEGLDVTIIPPADPDSPPRLVAAGQADLAVSYQTQLNMLDDHGLALVRVATLIDRPLNTIMALSDSGIHSIADLKGRKIGVSVGGVEEAVLGTMLRTNHLSLSDVTIVKVNFQILPALMSHQLDAAIGGYSNYEVIEAQQMGRHPAVFTPEANGVPAYDELILVAARSRLGDPKLKRFLLALQKGTECLLANPDDIWASLIRDYPEMNNALNRAAWAATLPSLAADPAALDAARYEAFQAFLFQTGIIAKKLPLEQFAVQLSP
jgi:putative hydroxymethylpyrimidine transport system substrate-binding protein